MMWQRFTERARRVVFFAQEEAGRLGENFVSTEHLLLGLVRENDSVAARVLDKLGVSTGAIRAEIESRVTRGEGRLEQDMQLTPRGKRVIDLAYDEARQLNNNYIGSEHLLLGLIREGEGLAAKALLKLGVPLEAVRDEIKALQDQPEEIPATPAAPPGTWSVSTLRRFIRDNQTGWGRKSLASLFDVSIEQFRAVLDVAQALKALDQSRTPGMSWEYPRTMAMIFEKPSLRTRVSFEASMVHLGGHGIYLAPGDVGLGVRESVADVAEVLARWVDVIVARVFAHSAIDQLMANSSSPVINALSDREHPLQAFADMLTLQEHKGHLGNSLKLAYLGDGNNVLHALLLACAKTGVNLSAAYPEGYGPDKMYVEEARRIAGEHTGAKIVLTHDPIEATQNADAVYTDVWASMGQEAEREARAALFKPYQVNRELLTKAKSDAIVLHCLPSHRGEEITDEMMERHKNCIFDEAENRLHTQKALLLLILGL